MNFYTKLLLPALSLLILPACKGDEELPVISDATFSGIQSLDLKYCGEAMPGKFATLAPGSDNHVTITFGSELDLSSIPGAGLSGKVPAPGVLPGSVSVSIPVSLKADGSRYVFSGSGETDFVSYHYTGSIRKDVLSFDFTDVVLKNSTLANSIWCPAPAVKGQELLGWQSSPFHVVWDIDPFPELPQLQFPVSDIVQTLLNVPFIPVYNNSAYSSISQLFCKAVQTVAFRSNGNIPVRYFSSSNGATQLMTTNGNTLQYVVLPGDMMKLYINPLSAFSIWLVNKGDNGYTGDEPVVWTMPSRSSLSRNTSPAGSDVLKATMERLIASLAPVCADGIPMNYQLSSASLNIWFNSTMTRTLFQNVLLPLLQDQQLQAQLMQALANDPRFAPYLTQIQQVLPLIPQIIQHTSRFELGFSFIPYAGT